MEDLPAVMLPGLTLRYSYQHEDWFQVELLHIIIAVTCSQKNFKKT